MIDIWQPIMCLTCLRMRHDLSKVGNALLQGFSHTRVRCVGRKVTKTSVPTNTGLQEEKICLLLTEESFSFYKQSLQKVINGFHRTIFTSWFHFMKNPFWFSLSVDSCGLKEQKCSDLTNEQELSWGSELQAPSWQRRRQRAWRAPRLLDEPWGDG